MVRAFSTTISLRCTQMFEQFLAFLYSVGIICCEFCSAGRVVRTTKRDTDCQPSSTLPFFSALISYSCDSMLFSISTSSLLFEDLVQNPI